MASMDGIEYTIVDDDNNKNINKTIISTIEEQQKKATYSSIVVSNKDAKFRYTSPFIANETTTFAGKKGKLEGFLSMPELPWLWCNVNILPSLTMENIKEMSQKNWKFDLISCHANITMQDIIDTIDDYSWKWNMISKHIHLTIVMIDVYPLEGWHWPWVSKNPGILIEDIMNRPGLPWDWDQVSCNPNLIIDDIIKYPTVNWNWINISKHPNITIQDIMRYPEYPWDWNYIFINEFSFDQSLYINNSLCTILLLSMLEQSVGNDNNDSNENIKLCNPLLVFYNDFHLWSIAHYL